MTTATRDHAGRPIVCISGAGLVSSLGQGLAANWTGLVAGRSGVAAIDRFETGGLKTRIAALLAPGEGLSQNGIGLTEHCARQAIDEAFATAGLPPGHGFPGGLVLGFPPVEMPWRERLELSLAGRPRSAPDYGSLLEVARHDRAALAARFTPGGAARRLAETYGTTGVGMTVNTACATGATAVQIATEAIRRGADAMLVVAADASVSPDTLLRFSLLSALSTANENAAGAMRPFCLGRDGFVMGEGAGAVVLESADHLRARGGRCLGVVAGVGETADAYHLTRSSPDGAQIIRAMRAAIADAGLSPADIHHVNAHGTSTPENDKMEALGLTALFGDRVMQVPVTANKSMIGHTLSAGGLIEAIVSLLTIQTGTIPPTINQDRPDPAIHLDIVRDAARSAHVRHVLSNAFGFGGQNTCLVLSGEPA